MRGVKGLNIKSPGRLIASLAIYFLALPLLGQSRVAQLPVLPDDQLTPGVIAETDVSKVCVSGYSKTVRHTSGKLKAQVYREYGITKHKRGAFQVDHRIPLGLGGGDTLRNVWGESCETHPGCHEKDALELRIHEMVCHEHSMTLEDGQRLFAGNWIEGYRKYLGDPETRNDAPEN